METIPQSNPRPARVSGHEHCTVAREDGSLASGVLLNLSEEGFCVETSFRPELGERVYMRVVGVGCFSGIVRWTDGVRTGGVIEPFITGAFDDKSTPEMAKQP